MTQIPADAIEAAVRAELGNGYEAYEEAGVLAKHPAYASAERSITAAYPAIRAQVLAELVERADRDEESLVRWEPQGLMHLRDLSDWLRSFDATEGS